MSIREQEQEQVQELESGTGLGAGAGVGVGEGAGTRNRSSRIEQPKSASQNGWSGKISCVSRRRRNKRSGRNSISRNT